MKENLTMNQKNNAPGIVRTTLAAGGMTMSMVVVTGERAGPSILMTAGIHGAEYVGIETARRLSLQLNPSAVHGRITILPCVNQAAFRARVPAINPLDGKNINRMFPGHSDGSSSEAVAAALTSLQEESDFYLDLHGGDLHENLSPYVYFQGTCEAAISEKGREACRWVDVPVRVRSSAETGAYNSANLRGTPAILIERGCAGRWSEAEVEAYLRDVRSVLFSLGALDVDEQTVNARKTDVEQMEVEALYDGAPSDGCWYPTVKAGMAVKTGDLMGELRDFDGNLLYSSIARKDGTVLYLSGTLFVPAGTDLVAY